MDFNYVTYLPNSEQRVERLQQIVNNRPVAIVLYGASVAELEKRIKELQGDDIVYCTVSRYWIIEQYILEKIKRNISYVMCSADPSFESFGESKEFTVNFLERQEPNMFISTQASFDHRKMNEFISKYDEKLLFHETVYGGEEKFPSPEYPLHFPGYASLSIILSLTLIAGASKVALFGADGGRVSQDALYYKESTLHAVPADGDLKRDTGQFNPNMLSLLERVYRTYNLAPVDIVNCSLNSHYTPFPKLSYTETFDFLRS